MRALSGNGNNGMRIGEVCAARWKDYTSSGTPRISRRRFAVARHDRIRCGIRKRTKLVCVATMKPGFGVHCTLLEVLKGSLTVQWGAVLPRSTAPTEIIYSAVGASARPRPSERLYRRGCAIIAPAECTVARHSAHVLVMRAIDRRGRRDCRRSVGHADD